MQFPKHTVRHLPTAAASRDFFDTPDGWQKAPELAYASWISLQAYRASSKTVYKAMFGKMIRWMNTKGITLETCEMSEIFAFLEDAAIEKKQRSRYIRMSEKVFDHLTRIGAVHRGNINPAREAARKKAGVGENDPTQFFTVAQQQEIIAAISIEIPAEERVARWMEVRDRALISVLFGGGAKVSQVRRMTVNCMSGLEGWLHKADERGQRHRARMEPWAVSSISAWLALRAQMNVPGKAMFPAAVSGRNRLAGATMHGTSIHRRTLAFLVATGIASDVASDSPSSRACAQTLRNTYAAMLFVNGASDELVTEYLGLTSITSAQRLHASWKTFAENESGMAHA